jgi:hypothetical protein
MFGLGRTVAYLGRFVLAAVALISWHSVAIAVEAPPSSDAATVLGANARGSNYEILNPVVSDGLLQIFSVKSRNGRFSVAGRELLQRRLGELAALAALEQMSQSELFTKSLAKSAASPLRLGRDLLRNPFGTIEQTVSGATQAFDQVKAGVSNPGSDRDGIAASSLGVSSAKRQLAAELGVDPYTDFKPLSDKLDEVATTIALGGLAPKAAFSAIGGGAGAALSYSSSAEGVRALIRDKTPAQLVELNRQRLRAMGVSDRTVQTFLENDFYTPADQTRLADALTRLGQVKNRAVFVDRAAGAHSRDLAFFLVRRAEMIAGYQRSSGGMITQFVSANGFPVNILADGRALIIAPIDELSWSETPLKAMAAISNGLSGAKPRPVELRVSGKATPAAKAGLQGLGWTVIEGHKP